MTGAEDDRHPVRRATTRFPDRLFRHGHEPDPRLTLANERTLLAWVRTSVALVAGGVALEALGLSLEPRARLAASVLLLLLGSVLPLVAWVEWVRTERAMRLDRPLPASQAGVLLAGGAATVGVLVLVGVLVPATS